MEMYKNGSKTQIKNKQYISLNSKSTISVIITTKNRKGFLKEAINSFLNQTLKPFEIIVVDDNSNDGTAEMLANDYSNSVKHVINTRGGLSAGRNIGFENATGDFIKIFDDDDVLSSNSLEVQYNELKKSGKQFIYSPYIKALYDNGWKPTDALMHHYPLPSKMSVQKFMIKGGIFVLPSCLFTKEIIDKTGPYNETVTTYEDWDYLWRLAKNEPHPAHSNKTLMIYRQHGFQMTHGMLKQDLINKDKITILKEAFEEIKLGKKQFNWYDRALMQYRIYQTLNFISDNLYVETIINEKPFLYPFYRLLFRLENKYQRIKSKSNWTTWHGVELDFNKSNFIFKTHEAGNIKSRQQNEY